jgi:glycosyltransferase involved in cell wall biosynthesis
VTPLVSVIIPCRNGAETLSETLASVMDQRWPAIEIIVVENRSIDDSAAVARASLARHRGPWQVVETDASGINAAREAGYALSCGDYVQWLDADDTIDPHKIERQLLALEASPGHDVAHGDWVWEITVPDLRAAAGARLNFPVYAIAYGPREWRRCPRRADTVAATFRTGPTNDYLLRLLADWWAPPHAYLTRRRAADWLQAHRAFSPSMSIGTDREYFTVAALHGFRFLHVAGANSIYHTRPGVNQMTGKASASERARALSGMQRRLEGLPRRDDASPLDADHRFLLQQDRRLWVPPRAADLDAASRARPAMRDLHDAYARIKFTDTLEQHAKMLAWQRPGLWERHVAILRELHCLRDEGVLHPHADEAA